MKAFLLWLAVLAGFSLAAAQNFPPPSSVAPHVWLVDTVGLLQVEELDDGRHRIFLLGDEKNARIMYLQRINTPERHAVMPLLTFAQLGCALTPADLDSNMIRVQCGRVSAGLRAFDYTQ